jgi:hypothetical protein
LEAIGGSLREKIGQRFLAECRVGIRGLTLGREAGVVAQATRSMPLADLPNQRIVAIIGYCIPSARGGLNDGW